MIRVCGIDPGATTALVCLDVPVVGGRIGGERYDLNAARWVGHAVVRASTSKLLTDAEQRGTLGARIAKALDEWRPALIVLEEPCDWRPAWKGKGRAEGVQATGTAFGLGSAYGLALAASYGRTAARVYAYPVNNHRGRPGWMQGGNARPQKRDVVMAALRAWSIALGSGDAALSEDVLMALGVLRWHLATNEHDRAAA